MAVTKPGYILDTSAYSAFNRGDSRLRKWFTFEYQIHLPLIVVGELRAGFSIGTKKEENEQFLTRFSGSPAVQIMPLTLATTTAFTALFQDLRQAGIAVSTNDLWIAALAREHSLPILTLDNDFKRIPNIDIISL